MINNTINQDFGGATSASLIETFKAMIGSIKQENKMRQLLPKLIEISGKSALAAAFSASMAGYAKALGSFMSMGTSSLGMVRNTMAAGKMASLNMDRSRLQVDVDRQTAELDSHAAGLGANADERFDPIKNRAELDSKKSTLKDLEHQFHLAEGSLKQGEMVHAQGMQMGQLSSSLLEASSQYQSTLTQSTKENSEGSQKIVDGAAQNNSTTFEALARTRGQITGYTTQRA